MGSPIDFIQPYKPASVYIGPNEWFVEFYYYSNSKEKYLRKKLRLKKRNLSEADRDFALEHLCKKANRVIDYRNSNGIFHESIVPVNSEGIVQKKTFLEWVDVIKDDEKLADSTKKLLSAFKFNYSKFLKVHEELSTLSPTEIADTHVKLFSEFLQENVKGKSVNEYLWAMQVCFDNLADRSVIREKLSTEKYRVSHGKNESGSYRPLTAKEKEDIFTYTRANNPDFYIYVMAIYYTCIRPSELRRLKVEHFDFERNRILVPWFSAKNGLTKYVQMLSPFKKALLDYGFDKQPNDSFAFSNLFDPEKEENNAKYASDIWRKTCKKIGIDVSAMMYGLKHTFNCDYVENNKKEIDWEWLRRHNRHATIQQTQEYISEITAYFLDENEAVILNYHN